MAKNKNRDRKRPQAERAPQTARTSALEPQDEQRAPQMTPSDVARKRQKRFGHN
ncbi:hypothetical protein [Streptomyces sp. S.PNR 29]|uniref:hypothetical protein n=1 Tax=Streptomyces sp. S.PNR 29 TaxID=2973805 RepID=UPI0025AFFDE0|nr:hypothetical protein [Streptomyces sp. S.PNR 29]MDN0194795.1 hypothetical protein [Streptomyces sp. S.PNR 29]